MQDKLTNHFPLSKAVTLSGWHSAVQHSYHLLVLKLTV